MRFLSVLLLIGTSAALSADEAILTDGRKVTGKLVLKDRDWSFVPAEKSVDAQGASLQRVRFDPTSQMPLRAGHVVCIDVAGEQRVTGRLVDFGSQWVKARTVWGGDVSIARPAVIAVKNLPGRMPVFLDDFEAGLKNWKISGNPELGRHGTSGDNGLTLSAGQSAGYALARPLDEGWAGINFLADGDLGGATWLAEATFQTKTGPRRVSIHLAGDGEGYTAQVPDVAGTAVQAARSPGWHRLTLRFTPASLRISVDESVVWYSLENGPGGPLIAWKLSSVANDEKTSRGVVHFDEFAIYRADAPPRRTPGDPKQDEIWLASGDQLFCETLRLDRTGAQLPGKPVRTISWTELRGVYPARSNSGVPARPTDAVRLEFDAGIDADPDIIDGVMLRMDEKQMTFRNPLLEGERTVDRRRLRSVQWFRR